MMDLQEMGCADMEWIDLAQNRDRWQALVNVIMNLRGKSCLAENRLLFQEGPCSVE
jgi:hypothetical protein